MPEGATTEETRKYHSPLRQAQTDLTRELILDALTELLADRPSDEITTKDLAEAAGVSERTVYRHFPDRAALHEGVADRSATIGGDELETCRSLDDVVALLPRVFEAFDANEALARAAVLLNADPRRLAPDSRVRLRVWQELADATFADAADHERRGLAALTRVLGSSQTWLRLREEYGMGADQAGPLVAWAVDVMLDAVRAGNPPPGES